MNTQTTPETAANPNGCDENHCFCDRFDEHGDIDCTLDHWQVIPPPRPLTLDQIIERIIAQLNQINEQIDEINDKLRSI